ncbi:PhnD/SsuA/transferrin family substrate-binding protein [Rhodoplanes serenus]|jgi:NitT/TauT family transport system substrate-binding protein|uniref:PhnD/SsuA/transferrin family substrate-binding protein n=1 Tax=Rhodoplanes serenus TaxID=200615 RepID=A0A9X5AV27_9BRAD|nr:ABC transporter substrate-binding protein [Rhodoplanes serenus]MTW18528.1 PhnD/SsuA/transferrin family substrate-binding protein [Rhodoplanes serenus]
MFRTMLRAVLSAAVLLVAAPAGAVEISVTQWGTSLYGAPYAVAMAEGLFKKAGVDITSIIGSGGGGTTVRNLLASETPYGDVAIAAALAAQRQGLDVIIVNTGTRSTAEASLVTMPDSPIRSLKDLEGKKVAVTSPKGVSEMLLLMALKQEGVDATKVERVASGGYVNGLTMLEQGAVAAAALIEPLSIIRADKYRTVVSYGNLLPPMTTSVGITTRAYAKSNPERLRAIIAGRAAGVEALYENPARAAEILTKAFKLDPAVAQVAVANMIGPRMWSTGAFDRTELDRTVEGLRLIGEITGPVDWSKLLDPSFLPPAVQGAK